MEYFSNKAEQYSCKVARKNKCDSFRFAWMLKGVAQEKVKLGGLTWLHCPLRTDCAN